MIAVDLGSGGSMLRRERKGAARGFLPGDRGILFPFALGPWRLRSVVPQYEYVRVKRDQTVQKLHTCAVRWNPVGAPAFDD
jgi:hypothetical protein